MVGRSLNKSHYEKLRALYSRHSGAKTSTDQFHAAVWSLLARYDALGGHGYQVLTYGSALLGGASVC